MKIVKTNPILYGRFRNLKVFNKQQFVDFKKYIEEYITKTYIKTQCKTFVKSANIYVEIDKQGLEHTINVGGSIAKLKSTTVITKILENCSLDSVDIDKNDATKKNYKFSCIVDVDSVLWLGSIVVKQKNNGHFLYDHYLSKFSKIEIP